MLCAQGGGEDKLWSCSFRSRYPRKPAVKMNCQGLYQIPIWWAAEAMACGIQPQDLHKVLLHEVHRRCMLELY
jgi:hypothetical protein